MDLEDAFADSPEIGIVRENKQRSGLIRYRMAQRSRLVACRARRAREGEGELRGHDARRQRPPEHQRKGRRQASRKGPEGAPPNGQEQAAKDQEQNPDQADNPDQPLIAAPERKYPRGVIPFRSDRWAQVYSRRIDETIAALKSKGVPVFWVGLPSIRGTRSTADAVYLNDLFRARAERAGINYIDVWDGFVDDAGKYSSYGPDYEGQMRRLRSGDGVYFTKYGARKLAHYVEREIRRYMNNRAVVSLPTGPIAPVPDIRPARRNGRWPGRWCR